MLKPALIPWLLFLNAILFSLFYIGHVVRNEGLLRYVLCFSLGLGALLFLIQIVCYLAVKDARFRNDSVFSFLAGLGIVWVSVWGAPQVKQYYFEKVDRKVFEKAVAEVRATGQSTAWKSVAYDMRVSPSTGPVLAVDFCIARDGGYDNQWYRWTAQVYPKPDPPAKTKRRKKSGELNHNWLAPQWSEYTTL